jgi:hypothetical protein
VSLLAVGVAMMLLGHASDVEKTGRRLYLAEPIPGTEEPSAAKVAELRIAA